MTEIVDIDRMIGEGLLSATQMQQVCGRIVAEHVAIGQSPPDQPRLGQLAVRRILDYQEKIDARRANQNHVLLFSMPRTPRL
jgi:hypothetical protein